MSEMIEVEASDLQGLALNWATGVADGRELEPPSAARGRKNVVWCEPFAVKREGQPDFIDKARHYWKPSTDWADCGPLRDKYQVAVYDVTNGVVAASLREHPEHWIDESEFECDARGPTALIAICRAIVKIRLGEKVQVPAELIETI